MEHILITTARQVLELAEEETKFSVALEKKRNEESENYVELLEENESLQKSLTEAQEANKELKTELERVRQIVNSERLELIHEKYNQRRSHVRQAKRLDYLQNQVRVFWPRVTPEERKRFTELLEGITPTPEAP